MTNILNSIGGEFSRLNLDGGASLVSYVTNLMETVLSMSSASKKASKTVPMQQDLEDLLHALNTVLVARGSRIIETAVSPMIILPLAEKSHLIRSADTLVLLVKTSGKLAKAFRKMHSKSSSEAELKELSFEKYLSGSLAALDFITTCNADENHLEGTDAKFIRTLKLNLGIKIRDLLSATPSDPGHMLQLVQKLVRRLKSDFDVNFENIGVNLSNIKTVGQIELLDALSLYNGGGDDSGDIGLLISCLRLAVVELKKIHAAATADSGKEMSGEAFSHNGTPDGQAADTFGTLCQISRQQIDQLRSIASLYADNEHNMVWTRYAKAVLKNCLKAAGSSQTPGGTTEHLVLHLRHGG